MLGMKTAAGLTVLLTVALLGTTVKVRGRAVSGAETPPQEAASKASAEKKSKTALDAVLRKWAEADDSVREMRVNFTRIDTDATFSSKSAVKGQASIKKDDCVRVDLRDEAGRIQTIWLLDGKRLHRFDGKEKTETVFEVPENWLSGWEAKDAPLPLPSWINWDGLVMQTRWQMFGPQSRDFTARFTVRLAKEDQWYIYLDITPRDRQEKTWFARGRVVLRRDNYRVRQLWLEHANGDETLTDYRDICVNPEPPITRESLRKGLPKGWKRIGVSGEEDADKPSSRR